MLQYLIPPYRIVFFCLCTAPSGTLLEKITNLETNKYYYNYSIIKSNLVFLSSIDAIKLLDDLEMA